MGSNKSSDPLSEVVAEMETYCKDQQLQCFYCLIDEEDHKPIYWDDKYDPDWRNFLRIAKSLKVNLVYFGLLYFDESEIEEALAEEEESSKEIESFRSKVGFITNIDLAFIHEGVFHIYRFSADWLDKFQELTESEADSDEEIDESLIHEWAEKLASHPRYATCKNKSQRGYLLEEIGGDENEDIPGWAILKEAERIYFVKVKPKEDERLKKEAEHLHDQGLNLNAIAQKLGISRDRVSGLLKS